MATRSHDRHDEAVETGSTTDSRFDLTDEQWELIEDLFPWTPPGKKGGCPERKPRECLEGIFWILRTGAPWKELPDRYPSKSTCHLRFKTWTENGIIEEVLRRLLLMLDENGQLDCSETFGDGTFSSAKKGVNRLERPVAERERRSCCWSTPAEHLFRSIPKQPTSMKSV